jgi:hypothetical protein
VVVVVIIEEGEVGGWEGAFVERVRVVEGEEERVSAYGERVVEEVLVVQESLQALVVVSWPGR